MKTRTKILGLLAVSTLAVSTAAIAQLQPQPVNNVQYTQTSPFTDPQNVRADLARIDARLNNTQSFSGRFTQYGADGSVAAGNIYLKRPGKMRFEYDAPNPLLIVSDGVTLVQQDRALETADRVPLSSTPLNFFLKQNVDLARDTEVIGLLKNGQDIRVTARDGSGEMDGDITLVFNAQTLDLQAWMIADSFGGETSVLLSDLKYNQRINSRLFVHENANRRERRRE